MNATVARLTARTLLGRRRAALLAILLILCGAVRLLGGTDEQVSVAILGGFALGTLVPLLALITGADAIGPEIDDGSIIYLLSKPLSRFTIVGTKVTVAAGVITAVAAVPVLVTGLVLEGNLGELTLGYTVGAAVAGVTYCALFLLLAVLTRNAVVIGLLYALIWESLIGGFVPGAQVLSIQQWSLAISERLIGSPAERLGVTSAVSLGTGVALLAVVFAGSVAYAGRRLQSLRLTGDD